MLRLPDDCGHSRHWWMTNSADMAAVVVRLDRVIAQALATHQGLLPLELGDESCITPTFAQFADFASSLPNMQDAPPASIRLRISRHAFEVQSCGDLGNIVLAKIQIASPLDLDYGDQKLVFATTNDLLIDDLPSGTWVTGLENRRTCDPHEIDVHMDSYRLDRNNKFILPRARKVSARAHFPVPLTTFVGRAAQIADVKKLLAEKRLVTLCGDGGVGKTRLALEVASRIPPNFFDGQCYIDLAPIAELDLVASALMTALDLPDKLEYSAVDTLIRFIGERRLLIVLDNCEHVLDACAELLYAITSACSAVTILATSRQPIGISGEMTWRVPPLPLANEALELFSDRARLVQPDFTVSETNIGRVNEICRRLDGIPLAIELAAARVEMLSLDEIVDGLEDRFALLTRGARTAMQRQRTLRASMDWSHALLTENEQIVFRRLATFSGTFDITAAEAVAAGAEFNQPYQVFDLMTLLVSKSLVTTDGDPDRTRYRLLETTRQYAAEKLGESGEANAVYMRHRDHYATLAVAMDTPEHSAHAHLIDQARTEIDNLRAAFAWSREVGDTAGALQLASTLQPYWFGSGDLHEGLTWFDSVLAAGTAKDLALPTGMFARGLANKVMLSTLLGWSQHSAAEIAAEGQKALALAREVGDPRVLASALTACGCCHSYNSKAARCCFAEAIKLAHSVDDKWTLSQIRYWELVGAYISGNPNRIRTAANTAQDLAEAIGNRFVARQCRLWLCVAMFWQGDLPAATTQLRGVVADADSAEDVITRIFGLYGQAWMLAHLDARAALAAAEAAIESAAELGEMYQGLSYAAMTYAALAHGDVEAATQAGRASFARLNVRRDLSATHNVLMAQLALAQGDLIAARRYADIAVGATTGWHLSAALTARARIAVEQVEPGQARDDVHAALACSTNIQAHFGISDGMELLASLLGKAGNHQEAGRLFGAASKLRHRTGEVRFKVWDQQYAASMAELCDAMGSDNFDAALAEGAAMSTEEAIAYAQRGRGKRKRPDSGWESLTPAERNVVKLVTEGLEAKDIAARLFISVRTVQTHLGRIYAKLGLNSRFQLVQEAARHT